MRAVRAIGGTFSFGCEGGTVRWPMPLMGVAWLLVGLVYLQFSSFVRKPHVAPWSSLANGGRDRLSYTGKENLVLKTKLIL